jgi:hypothetical protein
MDGSDHRSELSPFDARARAEIDIQIATAHRFPRNPVKFLEEAKAIAGSDPKLAEQCSYWLPARKSKNEEEENKPITGPSVRLAEIVASCWGNSRILGRIINDDGKAITAEGVAHDLEKNVAYSVEVRRGVITKSGYRFSADMVNTTANAAIALATRNVTFKIVPRLFVNLIEQHAAEKARGDERTLPERAERALAWFAEKGVPRARVLALLKIAGPSDITLDHLQQLQGLRQAIQDAVTTVDEIFPSEDKPAPQATAQQAPEGQSKSERLAAEMARKRGDRL